MARTGFAVVVLGLLLLTVAAQAQVLAPPVDLLAGLRSGWLAAEFRGAGDGAVTGIIAAAPGAAIAQVNIPSGTQFFAQRPGVQGQTALGSATINLGEARLAQVTLTTACTNLGLATPTPEDLMVPAACPDARMAQLAVTLDRYPAPQPVAQLAVWALSNNPPPWLLQPYLMQVAPGFDRFAADQRRGLVLQAADLLMTAGLSPQAFRMFWGR